MTGSGERGKPRQSTRLFSFDFASLLILCQGREGQKKHPRLSIGLVDQVLFILGYYGKGFSILVRRSGSSPGNAIPNIGLPEGGLVMMEREAARPSSWPVA